MGNSKARAVYEANLPDGYRRPAQNDQAMEAFIRQKYEKRKYIAAEWSSPATPEFPAGWDEAAAPAQTSDRKPEFKKLTVPAAASAKPAAAASPKPAQVFHSILCCPDVTECSPGAGEAAPRPAPASEGCCCRVGGSVRQHPGHGPARPLPRRRGLAQRRDQQLIRQ